ncbi:hypothetical protein JT359_13065 [Candidatus Poribacteria bacterium]|nr:hypothetical protein [Candidatus Poribacteria bacterium]
MFKKHWLLTISLTALVCLHSICPLYCAVVEQMSCGSTLIQNELNENQSSSSCCHRNDVEASSENDNTSEDGNTCCLTSFEVVLPEFTHRLDYSPRAVEHLKIASVSIDTLLMVGQDQQFYISIPHKLSFLPLTYTLSRRGPPFILS